MVRDGERAARQRFNGLEFSAGNVGQTVLMPVTYVDEMDTYMVTHTEAVGRIGDDGALTSLSGATFFDEVGTATLDQYESVHSAVVATGSVR